jgi:chorismate mutase
MAQIEASKVVQHALHAEWTANRQPPFANVEDLGKDIRPVLDRLTPAMMRALPEALPVLQRRGGHQLLEAHTRALLSTASGDDTAVRTAVAPLLALSK